LKEDTNFEHKILSKQEGQIVKDFNSISKTKRNQNQTWQKKTKTKFFEIFSFSRNNQNNFLKSPKMLLKLKD